jgi:hypothetical protein
MNRKTIAIVIIKHYYDSVLNYFEYGNIVADLLIMRRYDYFRCENPERVVKSLAHWSFITPFFSYGHESLL